MAGSIVISSIQLDSDNNFSILSNTGATLVSANGSGLNVSSSLSTNSITSDKIVSVANTKIDGNIVSSQITSVANTQLTGTVTNAQVGSSVYEGIGMRNRIINGDMRIAQRGTAAVTADGAFPVDRFKIDFSTDGAFSAQQDSSAPTGFVNSVKWTVTTADASIGSTQYAYIYQKIEGTNLSDLGWGTANAKTVTLSFWVRSSVTGTFGGGLQNGAGNRSYPFTYSISVADTWEQKTITVAGDTTGTWLTTTGVGLQVLFSLAMGSTYSGTAGAWAGATYGSATGATNLMGTLNATWYITGVQLEVGSVATPFERRPFGTELALCQRYYCKTFNMETAPAQNLNNFLGSIGFISQANQLWDAMWRFPVEMRTTPTTVTTYSPNQANANWALNGDAPTASTHVVGAAGLVLRASTPAAGGRAYNIHASASAEL